VTPIGIQAQSIGWIVAATTFAAAVFMLDLITPPWTAAPMLYVLPILLTWLIRGRGIVAFFTVGVLVFTWAGAVFSPGELTSDVTTNRIMASVLLIVIATLVSRQKQLTQQRKAGREALQESEERLLLALDSASMGTWEWDCTTDSLRWNERQFELFGSDRKTFTAQETKRCRGFMRKIVRESTQPSARRWKKG